MVCSIYGCDHFIGLRYILHYLKITKLTDIYGASFQNCLKLKALTDDQSLL